MDLTETALNLQDVSPSTQIIIIADGDVREQIPMKTNVAEIIPQAKVLTPDEFECFLEHL